MYLLVSVNPGRGLSAYILINQLGIYLRGLKSKNPITI